jgi:hypothetical protein
MEPCFVFEAATREVFRRQITSLDALIRDIHIAAETRQAPFRGVPDLAVEPPFWARAMKPRSCNLWKGLSRR